MLLVMISTSRILAYHSVREKFFNPSCQAWNFVRFDTIFFIARYA